MAAGQFTASVVQAAVQMPARGDFVGLNAHAGATLQFAGEQVGTQVVGTQAVQLVEPLLQVREVQRLPQYARKSTAQGKGQVGAQLDRLDKTFADDDIQRGVIFGGWRK